MPTMLRQKGTGDMYVFTSAMAQRADMEYVDVPDIAPPADPVPPLADPVPPVVHAPATPVLDKTKKPKGAAIKIEPAPTVVDPPATGAGDTLDALFAEGE